MYDRIRYRNRNVQGVQMEMRGHWGTYAILCYQDVSKTDGRPMF